MLMVLTGPSRSADLAALSASKCQFKPKGVSFLLSGLAKQSRQGKHLAEIFFASFPHSKDLCPVETLRHYMSVTSPLRKESNQLFGAIIKPHKPVVHCTIARWLKEVLKLSGVDVSMFTAHSTRSASVIAAADSGVTTKDILKAADWSTESVFRNFTIVPPTIHPMVGLYYLQQLRIPKVSCCRLVCRCVQYVARLHRGFKLRTSPLICETEPSEI